VPITLKAPAGSLTATGAGFSWSGGKVSFNPSSVGTLTGSLQVKSGSTSIGNIALEGQAVYAQAWYMDPTSFENLLKSMADDTSRVLFPTLTATDRAMIDTKAKRDALFSSIATQTVSLLSSLGPGIYQASGTGSNALNISFVKGVNPATAADGWDLGGAIGSLTPADINQADIVDVYTNRAKYNKYERAFRAASQINKILTGSIEFYLDNFFEGQFGMNTETKVKNTMGMNNAHEIGHHLGLFHTNTADWAGPAGGANDIMRQGLDLAGTLRFSLTLGAAKMGIHGNYTTADADKAIAYYAMPGVGQHNREGAGSDGNLGPGVPVFSTPTLGVFDSDGAIVPAEFDMGSANVDGAGGTLVDAQWFLGNLGTGVLKINSVRLGDGSADFSLVTNLTGQSLASETFSPFTLRFDPTHAGAAQRELIIQTDAGETVTVMLTAQGVSVAPLAEVASGGDSLVGNNLGGVAVGGTLSSPQFATIVNRGS
ncbi:MAG TPA: hypothetical protein PLV92_23430, partial [Pirellulaceae bacterium]|nr:hypothetical protein [Pirellulaceae bacterium]